ncbi:MAG TPA: hypothetical protein VF601_21720 [Beijerinckiaceae bacterium]|jgi:hypothetical protein
MDERGLRDTLEGLEIGMSLHVPDAWADREIQAVDQADRDAKMGSIAIEHDCNWRRYAGEQIFTKIPPTGLGRSTLGFWPPKP